LGALLETYHDKQIVYVFSDILCLFLHRHITSTARNPQRFSEISSSAHHIIPFNPADQQLLKCAISSDKESFKPTSFLRTLTAMATAAADWLWLCQCVLLL
jgi:hypothetical protein